MATDDQSLQVLVGPRTLDSRICRLVYHRPADEAWIEEWCEGEWVRTTALVRDVLKAPVAATSQLRRRGIPTEQGIWDRAGAIA